MHSSGTGSGSGGSSSSNSSDSSSLFYYSLRPPRLERLLAIAYADIPECVLYAKQNTHLYILSKTTKQITFVSCTLDKRIYRAAHILQDPHTFGMTLSTDESLLVVASLHNVYVLDTHTDDKSVLFSVSCVALATRLLNDNDFSQTDSHLQQQQQQQYTGFGATLDSRVVYVTLGAYMVCLEARRGDVLRVFQSTVSANRIVRSVASRTSNAVVSLLDDARLLVWNLESASLRSVKFEESRVYDVAVAGCVIPNGAPHPSYFISYSTPTETAAAALASYSSSACDSPPATPSTTTTTTTSTNATAATSSAARLHDLGDMCSVSSLLRAVCLDDELADELADDAIARNGNNTLLVCIYVIVNQSNPLICIFNLIISVNSYKKNVFHYFH